MLRFAVSALIVASLPATAEPVSGPVRAEVLRVIDGDTVLVRAAPWPGHSVEVSVRLRGIDAPEIRTRCAAEKSAGMAAAEALARLLDGGDVRLTSIEGDKYFGRVVADLATASGEDAADALRALGLVRDYGGGARSRSCDAGPETGLFAVSGRR